MKILIETGEEAAQISGISMTITPGGMNAGNGEGFVVKYAVGHKEGEKAYATFLKTVEKALAKFVQSVNKQ